MSAYALAHTHRCDLNVAARMNEFELKRAGFTQRLHNNATKQRNREHVASHVYAIQNLRGPHLHI